MIIAVTYDQGSVFQHFGRTQEFKIYEVKGKEILNSKIASSNGQGHGALARVLADWNVNVVICGGIGMGAIHALNNANIQVCSGASGDVDFVLQSFLRGTLITAEGICSHHEHDEGHDCSNHGCH